jgi:hypothetical protein
MMKHNSIALVLALAATWALAKHAPAAIILTDPEATYTQDFNGFPLDAPNGTSIETVYPNGWQDDTTTVASDHISLPGWHLYHPLSPAAENGTNGHQRLRIGNGGNTGSFWAFAITPPGGTASANPEKALGNIGSNTIADNGVNVYMGLQVINMTGAKVTSITITFDGEQWRDGQSSAPETLAFEYSLNATDDDGDGLAQDGEWIDPDTAFTAVPALNFTSPVFAGTGSSGNFVDGNTAGRVDNLTATIPVDWQVGTQLWLRWKDPNLAGNADDGLAIDDFELSVEIPEPTSFILFLVGLIGACIVRRSR